MVTVTELLIRQGASDKGGWCAAQLRMIGVAWPPTTGWMRAVEKKRVEISESDAAIFVGYGAGTASKSAVRRANRVNRKASKAAKKAGDTAPAQKAFSASDWHPVQQIIAAQVAAAPKVSFYESREWRELRYKALVKYGPVCQCCGASRATGAVIHVDHIKPRSKFPERMLSLDNLQILCADCNLGKSNKDDTDWR